MQNFLDLIAHQPNDIQVVLISDLHLSPNEPALVQAFLDLLDKLIELPHLKQFYILGDWFEVWLGDDVATTPTMQKWLAPILSKLKLLSDKNCQICIMHGNRDFLIGQEFCDKFGGKLIKEPYYLTISDKKIRLEHGDALCTDDKSYQRFRTVIRNSLIQKLFLALPIKKREQIAHDLRQKSKSGNATKSMQIMDVNQASVNNALENADILIHGHTHRPTEHQVGDKKRLVLGDWRIAKVTVIAEIAVSTDKQLALYQYKRNLRK